jgi:hypothetical protein
MLDFMFLERIKLLQIILILSRLAFKLLLGYI